MKKKLIFLVMGLSFVAGFALSIPSAKPLTHYIRIDLEKCTGCAQCQEYAGKECIQIVNDKANFVDNNCNSNFILEIVSTVEALTSDCEETEDFLATCPENAIDYTE